MGLFKNNNTHIYILSPVLIVVVLSYEIVGDLSLLLSLSFFSSINLKFFYNKH